LSNAFSWIAEPKNPPLSSWSAQRFGVVFFCPMAAYTL